MSDNESVLCQDFPEKLKQLRQARNWSQGMLAKKIGVEANRVSKYERGIMWPTLELLVRISNAFGISVDYLIREDLSEENESNERKLTRRLERLKYLPETDQQALLHVLDAFIKKSSFEKIAQEDFSDID
jgi:transcriptional regulator with XRE-family HTH domain